MGSSQQHGLMSERGVGVDSSNGHYAGSNCSKGPSLLTQLKQLFSCASSNSDQTANPSFSFQSEPLIGIKQPQMEAPSTTAGPAAPADPSVDSTLGHSVSCSSMSASQTQSTGLADSHPADGLVSPCSSPNYLLRMPYSIANISRNRCNATATTGPTPSTNPSALAPTGKEVRHLLYLQSLHQLGQRLQEIRTGLAVENSNTTQSPTPTSLFHKGSQQASAYAYEDFLESKCNEPWGQLPSISYRSSSSGRSASQNLQESVPDSLPHQSSRPGSPAGRLPYPCHRSTLNSSCCSASTSAGETSCTNPPSPVSSGRELQPLLYQHQQQQQLEHHQQDKNSDSLAISTAVTQSETPTSPLHTIPLDSQQVLTCPLTAENLWKMGCNERWGPLWELRQLMPTGCRSSSSTGWETVDHSLGDFELSQDNFSAQQLQPQPADACAWLQIPEDSCNTNRGAVFPSLPQIPEESCTTNSEAEYPSYSGAAASHQFADAAYGTVSQAEASQLLAWHTPAETSADFSGAAAATHSSGQLSAGHYAERLRPMSVYLTAVCPDSLLAEWQAQDEDDECSSPTGRTLIELQDKHVGFLQQQPQHRDSWWSESSTTGYWQGEAALSASHPYDSSRSSATDPEEAPAAVVQVQRVLRLSVMGPVLQTCAVQEAPAVGSDEGPFLQTTGVLSSHFTDEWPEYADGLAVDECGHPVVLLGPTYITFRGHAGRLQVRYSSGV